MNDKELSSIGRLFEDIIIHPEKYDEKDVVELAKKYLEKNEVVHIEKITMGMN